MKLHSHASVCLALLSPLSFLVLTGCTTASRTETFETVTPTAVADSHTYVPPLALPGNQPPIYPIQYRRDGVEGLVNVSCVIDATGRAIGSHIESSSGHLFNAPTLSAVRGWRFRPGTRDGVPIAMAATVPVGYVLAP